MNLAEWILIMFLSVALLVFLIVGVIFLIKFTSLLSEIEIMVQSGQSFFEKADDVADNIKDITSFGPLVRGLIKEYLGRRLFGLFDSKKHQKRTSSKTEKSTEKTISEPKNTKKSNRKEEKDEKTA